MNAALYARTSTRKSEHSIGSQLKDLKRFIEFKGWVAAKVYADEGVSGKNTDRPAFRDLMRDAELKKFDCVVCTKLDRFGRSTIDLFNSVEKLKSLGLGFVCSQQPVDTTSKEGKLFFGLLAIFAEFERETIRERVRGGRERAEREGTKSGKPCHRPIKQLDEAKLARLCGEGKSVYAIARELGVAYNTVKERLKTET